ncbi:recombinase family protein [Leisingera sp. NJS204]|uniref:recombinase family protein n=1 Tax=Leisingera sp. NJS204 TaxID=2508307 RepID=UPI001010B788|nr:recombinase family protein [Leisingera sp. NJS204]QAX28721.1 recombinase family protein [Leisingera sp. NJS204]
MSNHSPVERPRRVALYARYSTDMQNPMSVEDQFRLAERYAKDRGWTIAGHYADNAVSGTVSRARPQFQRLSADLASGKFDVVLAESVDRISRDAEHIAAFYKRARFNGVELHTTGRGKIDALTLGLSSIFATMFLEELADKTRRGLEGRVEKGLSAGGKVYGYRQGTDERGAPVKGKRAINEIEAAVVRSIFRDYAAGLSPIAIANRLNQEGIPSPSAGTNRRSSGRWKQNTINGNRDRGTGIINNELYIGRLVWNRLSYVKNPQTERRVSQLNPESEWRTAEVPELRIIGQDLWDEVKARQAALSKRSAKIKASVRNKLSAGQTLRRRKYLLSGLLHCGLCGGKMTVAGSGKYKTYYCANAKEMGPSVCSGFRGLRESVAQPLVLSGLRRELMKPEAYEHFRQRFQKRLVESQGAAEERLRLHDARLHELETKERNLLKAIEDGAFSPVINERLNTVHSELVEMREKRVEIVPPAVELPEDLPELYRAMVADLAASLSDEAVAGRAADELHELVDRVVVHWDEEAQGHWLSIEGNLLEMLRKSAPRDLDAVRGDAIFAEVGCGSRI